MKLRNWKYLICTTPFLIVTPLVVVGCANSTQVNNPQNNVHTIFHTNDVHGRLYKQQENDKYIGLDKLATYVKTNSHDLLLDAGDFIQGLPVSNLDNGATAIKVSQEMGYDFHTIGNHEFDFGLDNLLNLTSDKSNAKSNFLANNIIWNEEGNPDNKKLLYKPYEITQLKNGTQVGIIGVATPETKTATKPTNVGRVDFLDPIVETQKYINELKQKGIEIIIALSHLGVGNTVEVSSNKLAEQTNGLDIIIDGHTHTALEKAIEIQKPNENNNTYIVQTGGNTSSLGKLQFNIENGNTLTNVNSELIKYNDLIWNTINPDQNITNIVKPSKEEYEKQAATELFTSQYDLSYKGNYSAYTGESNLADFFMDAFVWDVKNNYKNDQSSASITKVDFAFSNAGGFRSDIQKGKVTQGMLETVAPFSNLLSIMELTRDEVIKLFDQAFKNSYDKGAFLNYSKDVSVEFDYKTQTFNKLEIGGQSLLTNTVGSSVQDKFIVVTNDFLRVGGDGYTFLANAKKILETTNILDSVRKYAVWLNNPSQSGTQPDNQGYSWDLYNPANIVNNDGSRIKILNRPSKV